MTRYHQLPAVSSGAQTQTPWRAQHLHLIISHAIQVETLPLNRNFNFLHCVGVVADQLLASMPSALSKCSAACRRIRGKQLGFEIVVGRRRKISREDKVLY